MDPGVPRQSFDRRYHASNDNNFLNYCRNIPCSDSQYRPRYTYRQPPLQDYGCHHRHSIRPPHAVHSFVRGRSDTPQGLRPLRPCFLPHRQSHCSTTSSQNTCAKEKILKGKGIPASSYIVNADCNFREKLIAQLRNNVYQCLICISTIRATDPIWSCSTCFHIYHLSCIKSWVQKSKYDGGTSTERSVKMEMWRCPSCQTEYENSKCILTYYCFCGRLSNPSYHPAQNTIPHGCDQICGKMRKPNVERDVIRDQSSLTYACAHPCTELCHPGPCPTCASSVVLSCPCGKLQRSLICGDVPPGPCGQICKRSLNAMQKNESPISLCAVGIHFCLDLCHEGFCPPCKWIIHTACYCGLEVVELSCSSEKAQKLTFSKNDLNLFEAAASSFTIYLSSIQRSETTFFNDRPTGSTCREHDDGELLGEFKIQPLIKRSHSLSELSISKGTVDLRNVENQPTVSHNRRLSIQSDSVIHFHEFPVHPKNIEDLKSLRDQIKPPPVVIGPSFSCGRPCGRHLNCGNHVCRDPCHPDECKPCPLEPCRCLTCPCGKVPLNKLVLSNDISGDRISCLDPIPTCPNICSRPHPVCGHACPEKCHSGACPPCTLSITINCRCARTSKKITCQRYAEMIETEGVAQLHCERVCKKKKSCGRHKCKNKCCDQSTHLCIEICGRRLSCQQHNCEEPCHPGPCGTCWRGVIYSELICRCGFTVLHPPQPCGTPLPECDRPCNRVHECDHPVRHNCHNEDICPPCTVLMTKNCPGGHGVQFSLPCFQPVLSCGRVCNKPLFGCSHTCQRVCHDGPCSMESTLGDIQSSRCTQMCMWPRPDCGHPCGLQCHEAIGLTCAQAAALLMSSRQQFGQTSKIGLPVCRSLVEVVCPCGRRKEKKTCHQVRSKQCWLVHQKLEQKLSTNDTSFHSSLRLDNADPIALLACDDACIQTITKSTSNRFANTATWKRGFDDVFDDGTTPTTLDPTSKSRELPFEEPAYSEFLKRYALNNLAFAMNVENQLKNIVVQFRNSIVARSDTDHVEPNNYPRVLEHRFVPMNKNRRRFIHELAEFYGMEAFSFDPEPHRHVMVLAKRGCARLPGGASDHSGSLTNILRRDFGDVIKLSNTSHPQTRQPTKPSKHSLPPSYASKSSYAQILRD